MEKNHGRLVVVMERELTEDSREALHNLLKNIIKDREVTFVAGLNRAVVLGAGKEGEDVFYNTYDYIPLPEMMCLMPWRHVWMVSHGRVYALHRRA